MSLRRSIVAGAIVVAACTTPALAPAPRTGAEINAPALRTWSAVVDVFADRNIPIKTIDRASGLIATDQMSIPSAAPANQWADCGKLLGVALEPIRATYTVRVRGDSTRSTVKVTVLWQAKDAMTDEIKECTTKGVWETDAETVIKSKAETT